MMLCSEYNLSFPRLRFHFILTSHTRCKIRCYRYIPPPLYRKKSLIFNEYSQINMWDVLTVVYFEGVHEKPLLPLTLVHDQLLRLPKYVKMFVLFFFFTLDFFPPPFAVLGCQAILVSDRNKSFRRGSVGQPLSPTKSSRIRSQRPLSPQPAGLGEIYCEERKKVVISWHFHDETWPKLCWLGGLKAHKECGCVWPSPTQSHYHWLTHRPLSPDHFPFRGLGRARPGSHPTNQDDQVSV